MEAEAKPTQWYPLGEGGLIETSPLAPSHRTVCIPDDPRAAGEPFVTEERNPAGEVVLTVLHGRL